MSDLKNRVALVTGGSRGIGEAIAIALANAGAAVAVNFVSAARRRLPSSKTFNEMADEPPRSLPMFRSPAPCEV